jgi:hypothetical protein
LFYADGQTDMSKVKVALHNFAYAPNKHWFSLTKVPQRKYFKRQRKGKIDPAHAMKA